MKPKLSIASDYAVLTAGDLKFYYGYEKTWCPVHSGEHETCGNSTCGQEEWCFTVTQAGKEIVRVPYTKFRTPDTIDHFNCGDCLLVGIGWYLIKQQKEAEQCVPKPTT